MPNPEKKAKYGSVFYCSIKRKEMYIWQLRYCSNGVTCVYQAAKIRYVSDTTAYLPK